AVAKSYIEKNYPGKSDFHNRITSGDGNLREAVSKTLDDLMPFSEGSGKSQGKRNITYLAGALGSKDILKGFVNNSDTKPEFAELRELMDKSIVLDFAEFKKKFSKHSGKPVEPYDDIRPLMSGIDVVLRRIIKEQELNVVIDNNLRFSPGEQETH